MLHGVVVVEAFARYTGVDALALQDVIGVKWRPGSGPVDGSGMGWGPLIIETAPQPCVGINFRWLGQQGRLHSPGGTFVVGVPIGDEPLSTTDWDLDDGKRTIKVPIDDKWPAALAAAIAEVRANPFDPSKREVTPEEIVAAWEQAKASNQRDRTAVVADLLGVYPARIRRQVGRALKDGLIVDERPRPQRFPPKEGP